MRFAIIDQQGRIKQISDITGENIKTIQELNANLPPDLQAIECGEEIDFSYFWNIETNAWTQSDIAEPEQQTISLSELQENQLIIMDALATIFETMIGGS